MRIHTNSQFFKIIRLSGPTRSLGPMTKRQAAQKASLQSPLTRLLGSFELQTERTPPEPRVEPRGLGRHDEDRSREYNHRRTNRERRWVPTAPHPRPTKLPPAAFVLPKERDTSPKPKCVRSPGRARLTVRPRSTPLLEQADIRTSAEMELANVVRVPRLPAPFALPRRVLLSRHLDFIPGR